MVSYIFYETIDSFVNHLMVPYIFYETIDSFVNIKWFGISFTKPLIVS